VTADLHDLARQLVPEDPPLRSPEARHEALDERCARAEMGVGTSD
jgi:hypothetical protein